MKRSIAATALLALLTACHPGADDVAPTDDRSAEAEPATRAKRIAIDVDNLSHDAIREIGSHIESLGDIERAEIKIIKDDEGAAEMLVTIIGKDLPSNDYLVTELKTFEGLADADVEVEDVHPDEAGHGAVMGGQAAKLDPNKTPDEIKAEVTARLRAQGVKGDIVVDVTDVDGERRVEVKVEDHGKASDVAPADAE